MAMVLSKSRLRVTEAKFYGNPQSGGGAVNLSQGQGITLTPNPILGAGTVALTSPVTNLLGGTGADTSATGGAKQYVKQAGVGAAFTVGTIPFTDIDPGYVRVDGTTPMTANWPAGAFQISSGTFDATVALKVKTTAATAVSQFQNATTDVLDFPGFMPGVTAVAVADGSAGVPQTQVKATEYHERIDATDTTGFNMASFFYRTKMIGGKNGMTGIFSFVDGTGGDVTVPGGSVGVQSYTFVDPFAPVPGGWTHYAFWGVTHKFQSGQRAVGMELDTFNYSGVDAYWSALAANAPDANVNSTIGAAINCGGGNKNSVGLTFQGSGTGNDVFQTGIYFPNSGIGTYAMDAAGLPATKFPLRIANGATIIARNAADSADYSLIRAVGTTNVAVGNLTTISLTSGTANTGVGNQALLATTTGGNNTAVGSNALLGNIGGGSNTAVGSSALVANTSGNFNTAVGMAALATITTNTDSTAVGYHALTLATGASNTAVGSLALDANSSGASNTAVGAGALGAVTTASFGTAVGADALAKATGGANTACGVATLRETTTGANNTAFGFSALKNNVAGNANVAIGYNAGLYETGSGAFYVDNQDRTNTAGDKANAILYGVMAAAPANQTLAINALKILLSYVPAYANNAAAVAILGAGALYYTDVAGEYILKISH